MFKKVDRFLNLNHLSDCSTIAAPESGSKPKVVNAVSYAIPKPEQRVAHGAPEIGVQSVPSRGRRPLIRVEKARKG